MAKPVISYLDARAKGLKRYFTGKRCKNGHLSERFVSNCRCIECSYEKTAQWAKENPDLRQYFSAQWREKNPNYFAEWAKDNPDAIRIAKQKWYKKNADKEIKRALKWAKDNREKARANIRNRQARKKKSKGSHTAEEVLAMLNRQKWKCVACGISIKKRRHIDHIIPLVLGGPNHIQNLQGLCPSCNCSKNGKDPIVWAREIGLLV